MHIVSHPLSRDPLEPTTSAEHLAAWHARLDCWHTCLSSTTDKEARALYAAAIAGANMIVRQLEREVRL